MNTKYDLLNLMLKDMEEQSPLYKPTAFWKHGSNLIIKDLEDNDIKNFRSFNTSRSYFVPNYGEYDYFTHKSKYLRILDILSNEIDNNKSLIRIQRTFNGYISVLNDFRVLSSSNIDKKPFTDKVSESKVGNPVEQHTIDNRNFSRSFMNYLLGLNFLKQKVDTSNIRTVMEIGGGFGTLGEILLGDERNDAFYINADIPPVGFVSSYYLQEVFGKENIADYNDLKDLNLLDISTLKQQYKALNICSWQVTQLEGKIDLFVNFISFQEMEPNVVQNYCNYINKLEPQYILLRNMLEGKRKKSKDFQAGVEEPILGDDYDTFLPNYKLVASDSAVFGFITEDGFHSQLRIYERI